MALSERGAAAEGKLSALSRPPFNIQLPCYLFLLITVLLLRRRLSRSNPSIALRLLAILSIRNYASANYTSLQHRMVRMASNKITNRSRRYAVREGFMLSDTRLPSYFIDGVVIMFLDFKEEDDFFDEPGIIHPLPVGISIFDRRDFDTRK